MLLRRRQEQHWLQRSLFEQRPRHLNFGQRLLETQVEGNLPRALSPQAAITHEVEAAWMAATLAVVHWHLRSVWPQVVEEETASEIHLVAQAGMAAVARPAKAMTAIAENEYFILTVGDCLECRKRVLAKVESWYR